MNEEKRVELIREEFAQKFGHPPTLLVRSPGRAEIIGNHTDYNLGFALAACIEHTIIGAFSPRG